MKDILATTSPTAEGEMLWRVQYSSSYYDNDPRMPGDVPVGAVAFVLAKGKDAAVAKAEPVFKQARHDKDKAAIEKIEAHIVTIESLIAAEEHVAPAGWHATSPICEIKLSNSEDQMRYRLGVCLIPLNGD